MIFTKFRRVIKAGFINFWRNGFVSLSSILIMAITLSVIGSVIFLRAGLTSSLQALSQRVDINVYFVTTANEADILALQTSLQALPEVADVQYTSADQALALFKQKHADDQLTMQALDEVGGNPLEASLDIRAKDTSQYEAIANFLQQQGSASINSASIVDKINYYQNKEAIDRLTHIINTADRLGLLVSIAFILISLLITFNTIRLVIFISKSEISVMKLVGASNTYIRGPFVVSGILYGLISALITLALFYPVTYWLGPKTAVFFVDLNVFQYYIANLPALIGILAGSGIAIGGISSWMAVRKYLNV